MSIIYRHYRTQKDYEIIGEAIHSETEKTLVIYKALYEDDEFPYGQLWARPKEMFFEDVEVEGKKVPRFSPISSPSDEA